jgi:hypothetical protein
LGGAATRGSIAMPSSKTTDSNLHHSCGADREKIRPNPGRPPQSTNLDTKSNQVMLATKAWQG